MAVPIFWSQASNVSIANMSIQEVRTLLCLVGATSVIILDADSALSVPYSYESFQYKDMSNNADVYDAGQ